MADRVETKARSILKFYDLLMLVSMLMIVLMVAPKNKIPRIAPPAIANHAEPKPTSPASKIRCSMAEVAVFKMLVASQVLR
jgi:hypothetical protein